MKESDNWWTRFTWRVRNEPVRVAEEFRLLLFALPVVVGVTVDDVRMTAVSTIISVATSWYASTKARNAVTPMHKVDSLEYDAEFLELEENYA